MNFINRISTGGIRWLWAFTMVMLVLVSVASPVRADAPPDLVIGKFHIGNFTQGDQGRTYTITVTNIGTGPTDGSTVTVTDTLPTGLTATAIEGDGWNCVLGTLTCTRNDVLAGGDSSYPDITLTVNVAVDAPEEIVNQASVSGGGDSDGGNNTASDVTTVIQKPDLVITGYQLRNAANNAVITQLNPNEAFHIRMTVKNQGGAASGLFYPGVFLDGKPNYGPDHDVFGRMTYFSDFRISPPGTLGFQEGCLYYDPDGLIDPLNQLIEPERGNYTRPEYNPELAPGASVDVDVYIGYPPAQYPGAEYNPIREGLPPGNYNIYLYVDPNCSGGAVESNEYNNSLGPISFNIGGFPSGPADIDVTINGINRGTYSLDPGESRLVKYPIAGGPVVISNSDGVGIVASLLQLRRPASTGGYTGIAQLMGVPSSQVTSTYVFPYYNGTDPTRYNSIEVSNFESFSTNVTITIGGVVRGVYPVAGNSSISVQYALADGPVVISNDNDARIISQIYELKRAGTSGKWNGQSQMMGVPGWHLSDTVIFPWYNNTLNDLDATLIFANAETFPTQVTVMIGGVNRGTYSLDGNRSQLVKYSVSGGPVVIKSNNNARIVASLLQLRRPASTGGYTGIAQLMGVPSSQVTSTYVFPYYNGTDPTRYNSIEVSNFESFSTNVTITIGGVVRGVYPVAGNSSISVQYALADGPVVISNDNDARIISQIYELKRAGTSGKWNGQSQMMGVPGWHLSDTVIFPWYNNTLNDLDATLIFGIP